MANVYGTALQAAQAYYGGGATGGGGGGTSAVFTPTVGGATATNQGITFGNTSSQSLAQNLPIFGVIIAAAVIGFALLRRK
jgi:hypothetical protein